MKLPIEVVSQVLREAGLDETTRQDLVRKMEQAAESVAREEQADRDPEQRVKKTYSVISVPNRQGVRWVIQHPDTMTEVDVTQGISSAVHAFNATRKGRRHPVRTVAEAFEFMPAKFFREQKLSAKTKEPVYEISIEALSPPRESDI